MPQRGVRGPLLGLVKERDRAGRRGACGGNARRGLRVIRAVEDMRSHGQLDALRLRLVVTGRDDDDVDAPGVRHRERHHTDGRRRVPALGVPVARYFGEAELLPDAHRLDSLVGALLASHLAAVD